MSALALVVLAWIVYGWLGRLRRAEPVRKTAAAALRYRFDARQNRALALAHPIAHARAVAAFADPKAFAPTAHQTQALRASLLHILGLRATLSDAAVREALPALLRQGWFRIDLDKLRAEDDPRAALALATARVAFAVRMACLLGWIEPALQWTILHQNAGRATDCFDSWRAYGAALARGRQQWIAGSRADSLGVAFDEAKLAQWLASRRHPWRAMAWRDSGATGDYSRAS